MKTLKLYLNKWRCGSTSTDYKCRMGEGSTDLLNLEGFQCCIGQFSSQFGIPDSELVGEPNPAMLAKSGKKLPEEYVKLFLTNDLSDNSALTRGLISINDDTSTIAEDKIKGIERILKVFEIDLEVVRD